MDVGCKLSLVGDDLYILLKKYHTVPYKKVPWYFGAVLFTMVLPCTTVLVPWYTMVLYGTLYMYHGTYMTYHGKNNVPPNHTMV